MARQQQSKNSVRKKRTRYGDDDSSRTAQLAWTFFVALGVAMAGLYQLASPGRALLTRDAPSGAQALVRSPGLAGQAARVPAGFSPD